MASTSLLTAYSNVGSRPAGSCSSRCSDCISSIVPLLQRPQRISFSASIKRWSRCEQGGAETTA